MNKNEPNSIQSQKPISYVSHLDIGGAGGQPSAKTTRVSAPKVALYKSWTACMDEGWAHWLFEQFEIHPSFEEKKPTAIVKYPDGDLLMSGYLMGEKYLKNMVAVAEVPLGEGKVILLGFGVQNRAQPNATFKLFFNSLYYASMK